LCSEGSYYYVVITRGKKEKGFIQLMR
jgi:hypothetical protein